MSTDLNTILKRAEDALREFDRQVGLTNMPPFSMELYDLIHSMYKIIDSLQVTGPTNETEPARFTRLAVEELTDRLSDAISENIRLSVELRARDELVVNDNKEAQQAFMGEALSKIFNQSKGKSK